MPQIEKKKSPVKAVIVILSILLICLAVTTGALAYAAVSVEHNLFQTGVVKINLNNGDPVIEEHEFLFEPGMTVVKEFFIENQSTCEVYFRVYLENVQGGLADVLDVTIKDGDQLLYAGKASEMTKDNVIPAAPEKQGKESRHVSAFEVAGLRAQV